MNDLKFLVIVIVSFFFGNWILDVGSVVTSIDFNGQLTNGAWIFPALFAYHLAWYLSIVCFLVLVFMYLDLHQKYLEALQ